MDGYDYYIASDAEYLQSTSEDRRRERSANLIGAGVGTAAIALSATPMVQGAVLRSLKTAGVGALVGLGAGAAVGGGDGAVTGAVLGGLGAGAVRAGGVLGAGAGRSVMRSLPGSAKRLRAATQKAVNTPKPSIN